MYSIHQEKLDRLKELSQLCQPLTKPDDKQAKINAEFFGLCVELVPKLFERIDDLEKAYDRLSGECPVWD